MREKQRKWISRLCLLAAGLTLLAALALAPRQGVYRPETDLLWDRKLRESVDQISRADQDGFYLVQRGERQYLALRGYGKAYEAPTWQLKQGTLTLSVQSQPGGNSGVALYRLCLGKIDTILAEENGQDAVFQKVIVL